MINPLHYIALMVWIANIPGMYGYQTSNWFISSVISFCMIENEQMYACWFERLKMNGVLLYISYDEIDQTRESICTWRRYTKTYIVLQKEHEWFIFVRLSHLSVSNRLHKTFTTLTDMIVFVKIKFSTNAMWIQL